MTSTKFSDVAMKLTAASDSVTKILVQCVELIVENTGDHAVH